MKKYTGVVVEIFIPDEYRNGKLLDVMNRTMIGFKVKTTEGIKEIIQEQNEFNSEILKDDVVIITEQFVSGKFFCDIERNDGDIDE